MSKEGASGRENITFEQGYEELKSIVARLNDEDISVHDMFEGFRRGKGLEQALRGYLTEREGELTEIEQGNNLPEFNIVAPSAGDPLSNGTHESPLEQDAFRAARTSDQQSALPSETEIPF
ncbi:MAG TPA: exodeoxyribonuclease VII small subunit [Solirubrobacteraceae bacterium]